jgi:hypothetical protein
MMNGLEIIKDSSIIKTEDFLALTEMKEELIHTMDTVQRFRTKTEMKVSVTNDMKCPTWDSKYWQAVREQNVMFTELVMLSYEFRKNALEIRKSRRQLGREEDDIEQELIQVEIERKLFMAMEMERTAKDRIREIKEWSDIKAELLPHLKHGDVDVDAHQLEAMQIRFANQARMVNEHTAIADARNVLGLAEMASKLGAG